MTPKQEGISFSRLQTSLDRNSFDDRGYISQIDALEVPSSNKAYELNRPLSVAVYHHVRDLLQDGEDVFYLLEGGDPGYQLFRRVRFKELIYLKEDLEGSGTLGLDYLRQLLDTVSYQAEHQFLLESQLFLKVLTEVMVQDSDTHYQDAVWVLESQQEVQDLSKFL